MNTETSEIDHYKKSKMIKDIESHQDSSDLRSDKTSKLHDYYAVLIIICIKVPFYSLTCSRFFENILFYLHLNSRLSLALKIIPIILLYYDHIFTSLLCIKYNSSLFKKKIKKEYSSHQYILFPIDSTCIACDVVGGTLLCKIINVDDISTNEYFFMFLLHVWLILGLISFYTEFKYLSLEGNHILVLLLIFMLVISKPLNHTQEKFNIFKHEISNTTVIEHSYDFEFPYSLFRAICYTILVVSDIIFFKKNCHRELDRYTTSRYGCILLWPFKIFPWVLFIWLVNIIVHVYYSNNRPLNIGLHFYENQCLNEVENQNTDHIIKETKKQKTSDVETFKNPSKNQIPILKLLRNEIKNQQWKKSELGQTKPIIENSESLQDQKNINFDTLDIEQVFQLAKIHNTTNENKATV